MEIIPAIDLRGGRCVRLVQGDYSRETVFGDDPVAMARRWERQGATRLHVVDLDGAREGEPRHLDVASRIARAVAIPIQLGGGIRGPEAARRVVDAGVDRVIVGTAALEPETAREIVDAVGESVVGGIDARDGRVAVGGWLDTTDIAALDLARRLTAIGMRWIVFTDIASDGMLEGPNLSALREIVEGVDASVIASGGITTVDDIRAVKEAGAAGAIIGSALYAGRITLEEALEAGC
jgi:phosphoribosylformimino-5-aminoimidazole carboxamide ribotide isomerase